MSVGTVSSLAFLEACFLPMALSFWHFQTNTRMKLLFSNYLGDYSYSSQGSVELICITATVSVLFLQNAVTENNSLQEFLNIFCNYSYMVVCCGLYTIALGLWMFGVYHWSLFSLSGPFNRLCFTPSIAIGPPLR